MAGDRRSQRARPRRRARRETHFSRPVGRLAGLSPELPCGRSAGRCSSDSADSQAIFAEPSSAFRSPTGGCIWPPSKVRCGTAFLRRQSAAPSTPPNSSPSKSDASTCRFIEPCDRRSRSRFFPPRCRCPSARERHELGPRTELYERVAAEFGLECRTLRVKFPRDSFFSARQPRGRLSPPIALRYDRPGRIGGPRGQLANQIDASLRPAARLLRDGSD